MKKRLVFRRQRGSALFSLAVLAVIAFAVWHFGGDRIRSMFASSEVESDVHVELIDLRCESDGVMGAVNGSVRNPTAAPVKLVAMVTVKRDGFPATRESASVEPSPLLPGETGKFKMGVEGVNEKTECRITGFLNEGQRIDFTGSGGR